jgi:hypothetical protein
MHAHVLVGRGKRTSHLSEQTLLAVLQYVRGDILAAQRGSRGAVADSLHAQSYKWMATIQVSCILFYFFLKVRCAFWKGMVKKVETLLF